MSTTTFANGTTAEDLRVLLNFWPTFMADADEAQQGLIKDQSKLLGANTVPFAWCHYYELPIKEHSSQAMLGFSQAFKDVLDPQQIVNWLSQITASPSQVSAIPKVVNLARQHFDAMEAPSEELVAKFLPILAETLGNSWSMHNTLRCVLYHGCFLNDLVERVRAGDDKSLFDAVRIDATALGCWPIVERISKAALLMDEKFFDSLKNAINGPMAKREQANFQKMRLVLEVLHEAGATRLSDAQLHELFVEELKLYAGNAKGGGNAKALRKFADTYMRKNTTT
ncbi:conserved hypothetical protein [Candidatus Nitrotoga sp. HW29]|uniref:hypothetical protein n=1 Tax=Candidatus Nitrotoga sp. HW29 TaxID=2886963 RepID=UPI001EF236CB|nr:hypothetical protein [Candidatus Nitrotoga sp. HW29]CAH1905831.1 conserved hypothetical protein [Candidatus Nitrotoga sp. HW29]